MKRIFKYIACSILMAVSSCNDVSLQQEECPIMMGAFISDIEVATKTSKKVEADSYTGAQPGPGHELNAELWFTLNPGDYSVSEPTDEDTNIPCHTYNNFTSSDINTIYYYNGDNSKVLKYPTTGENVNVYCVGLYPKKKWTYNNNSGEFTAAINGVDDLMFAPEFSGHWTQQFGTNGNSPVFSHLLCWIKITLCAITYDAIDAWGKITQISLKTATDISVNNSSATDIYYTGTQTLYALDNSEGVDLSIIKNDVGSLLCAPADKFELTLKTKDGRTAQKEMEISGDFQAGKQYVLVLYFDSLSVIDGVCTLESWENQNDNLYLE